MIWLFFGAVAAVMLSGPVGRAAGRAKGRAKRKVRANNPLNGSYWKRKIPPNQRLSNLGAALATPPTKKSQRAAKTNRHNKNVINNHKREKEQAEHNENQLKKENEMLRRKLHQASVLFEQIGTLATTYPNHWVQRVRTLSGNGVSVCHG